MNVSSYNMQNIRLKHILSFCLLQYATFTKQYGHTGAPAPPEHAKLNQLEQMTLDCVGKEVVAGVNVLV